jgi:hypothetical protein
MRGFGTDGLGSVQADVWKSLQEHGYWSRVGCGWLWDTPSNTARIMESLVRRGLATKTVDGHRIIYKPT